MPRQLLQVKTWRITLSHVESLRRKYRCEPFDVSSILLGWDSLGEHQDFTQRSRMFKKKINQNNCNWRSSGGNWMDGWIGGSGFFHTQQQPAFPQVFPAVCSLSPKGSGDSRDFRTRLATALRSLADEMEKGTYEVRPSQMKRDFIMNRLPPSCQPELLAPCECLWVLLVFFFV